MHPPWGTSRSRDWSWYGPPTLSPDNRPGPSFSPAPPVAWSVPKMAHGSPAARSSLPANTAAAARSDASLRSRGGWISSDQIPCRLEGKPPFWEEPISRCRANPRYRFHKPVSSPPCLALRIRSGKGSPCAVSGCSGSKYTFALPAWF